MYAEKLACLQQLQRNHRLREAIDITYQKMQGKKVRLETEEQAVAMLYCGKSYRKYLNGIKQDVRVAERIQSGGYSGRK